MSGFDAGAQGFDDWSSMVDFPALVRVAAGSLPAHYPTRWAIEGVVAHKDTIRFLSLSSVSPPARVEIAGRWAVSPGRGRAPRLGRLSAMRYLIGGEYVKRDVP